MIPQSHSSLNTSPELQTSKAPGLSMTIWIAHWWVEPSTSKDEFIIFLPSPHPVPNQLVISQQLVQLVIIQQTHLQHQLSVACARLSTESLNSINHCPMVSVTQAQNLNLEFLPFPHFFFYSCPQHIHMCAWACRCIHMHVHTQLVAKPWDDIYAISP